MLSDAHKNFDPNSPGLKNNNIFGLPFSEQDAEIVIIPVPWEVTVSYRPGTSRGPEQVFDASLQVDLFDPELEGNWKKGFHMPPIDRNIQNKSDYLRSCAELIIGSLYEGHSIAENNHLSTKLKEVNEGGKFLVDWLENMTLQYLNMGKKVAVLGGDHSTPLGYIKALGKKYASFGILQIDAHADLREAYEGFTYSHASIMHNVLKEVPQVKKLIQVGTRDYCDEEYQAIKENPTRIKTFFDKEIKESLYSGETWSNVVEEIITELPDLIYISFDIDGLDPKLCPNTGTPVPGGFELEQIFYLFKKIREQGKKIIGFDINEISGGENVNNCIDPIVGARALYKLCNYLAAD